MLKYRKILIFLLAIFCFQLAAEDIDYNFELYALNDRLISSEEILKEQGTKILVVDFFALYCEPCKKSLPQWEKFYKENKAKGLSFALVALPGEGDRSKCEKDLKNYFSANKYDFDVAFDKYSIVGKKYGIVNKTGTADLPQIFVFDKSGRLLFKADSYDGAVKKIKELL